MMEENWRPQSQGDLSSMDATSAVDWRSQLPAEARQSIVNKIVETLKRHLPISFPEGLDELRKIAIRFEEKIYTAATSQSDYLRILSMKMLSLERKTQPSAPINPINADANQNPPDSGFPLLDLVTVSYHKRPDKRQPVPTNRSMTDCESCSTAQDDSSTKKQKVSEAKVPTFSCPICMHSIVSLWSTICGHVFCEGCIKLAIQKQKKCPTCRRTGLTMENGIHRVFLPPAETEISHKCTPITMRKWG